MRVRSLVLLSLIVMMGSVACAAAPVDDGSLDRRSSSKKDDADDDDDDDDAKKTNSTPAPSSSTPAPPSASTSPAPQPSSPTGACAPSTAPAPCTAAMGTSTCTGLARCVSSADGSSGTWGACQCGLVTVPITASNDCVTLSCPATAPNLVGCSVTFTGEDGRGCVAHSSANPSSVFLKEGNKCGVGGIGGALFCSPTPSTEPLNATTCPMNSKQKIYVASPNGCPS